MIQKKMCNITFKSSKFCNFFVKKSYLKGKNAENTSFQQNLNLLQFLP